MRRHLFASAFSAVFATAMTASGSNAAVPSKVTAPAEKPLLDVKADAKTGKIIATLPKPDEDGISGRYIYLTQLGTGLGSAPIGLDRALSSSTRILVFRRIGKKVAAEVENSKFVASSPDPGERRIARESFATSVLWMGDVIDTRTDGTFTADLSGFLACRPGHQLHHSASAGMAQRVGIERTFLSADPVRK